MSSRKDLLDLLRVALPALRTSRDMARGGAARRGRAELVREVERVLQEQPSVELLELLDSTTKEEPLEAIETLWREGKRRVDAGEVGSAEVQLITAYIVVRLPALMSEVRGLREDLAEAKRPKKKKALPKRTRVATGVCSSCGSTNEYCVKANADLSKVEADCCNCNARMPGLDWKVSR